MSLLQGKKVSIGRSIRSMRDQPVYVVASEDTYAPKQYFENLPLPRVKVVVLPTPLDSGESSPGHVVERLKALVAGAEKRGEIHGGDEFWVCLDTDHHVKDTHLKGTLQALQAARQAGFELAISNPCFEVWLLLHHTSIAPGIAFPSANAVVDAVKAAVSGYHKDEIRKGMFPLANVPEAIQRARTLEKNPDEPEGYWPESTGTRIYRLLERALQGKA